ncbi:aldolase [Alteribacter natronophilus]|uniref:aldolase n=1 Tax=Alteribacter natronophilus TaxID=2583810 RepID=UPI00110F20B5|nr:aldolase [Alteribacter natronophilus]TMW70532.1 aldolase [Alteribacter natronophilus]
MIETISRTSYQAFGFNILSEVTLPEAKETEVKQENEADITIKIGDLTRLWEEHASSDRSYFVKEGLVGFKIPDVAIFSISEGREITVMPLADGVEDQIRLYVLGTCMGTVLMHRRILPLHGSAVEINGKAYAVVGHSGAGKSTTATAFLKKGFSLVSDDVIPVSMNQDGQPYVTPAYPQQKLWQESLLSFGESPELYRPLADRDTKYAVPVTSQFSKQSVPLAGVVELVKTDIDKITILPVNKLERLNLLFRHTYRNFFLSEAGLMDWHFKTSAKLVSRISFFALERPSEGFTAHEVCEAILSTIDEEAD